jgi:hypothetical protein
MTHNRPTGEGQLVPVGVVSALCRKGMFGKGESVYPQHPQALSLLRLFE